MSCNPWLLICTYAYMCIYGQTYPQLAWALQALAQRIDEMSHCLLCSIQIAAAATTAKTTTMQERSYAHCSGSCNAGFVANFILLLLIFLFFCFFLHSFAKVKRSVNKHLPSAACAWMHFSYYFNDGALCGCTLTTNNKFCNNNNNAKKCNKKNHVSNKH